ncbi:MAG: single-stranded DNA-binding protein [Proteobacteria bacterium]|nr:MAG: single-stranded DNA-binding protein [Pseudomonadota bacterium]
MNTANDANLCLFTGRLTKAPLECIKKLPNGNVNLTIGLAVKTPSIDKDGQAYERTDYPNLVIWGDIAEEAALELEKGMLVDVQGQLHTRRWKAEGETQYRYVTEILVTRIRPKAKAQAAA